MSRWYREGFRDALASIPSDPPYQKGNRHYAAYLEGYADGQRQLEQENNRK